MFNTQITHEVEQFPWAFGLAGLQSRGLHPLLAAGRGEHICKV